MKEKRFCSLLLALFLVTGITGMFPAQVQTNTSDNKTRKDVLASSLPGGFQVYAENTRFSLSIDGTEGTLLLQDKKGIEWKSVPDNHREDALAQGGTKLGMESLIQVKYADKLGNIYQLNGKSSSVKKDGLTCGKTTDGVILTFYFPKEGFSIPLKIVLGEDYMDVSIIAKDIKETNEAYKLTIISVLPYFGAADSEAQGYLFVPDGSGALIEMNGHDRYIDDYSQYVYSRDYASTRMQLDVMDETIRMPVFGLKKGNHAMMGIIANGAGRAIINAFVNGKRCSYNNVYADFIYRDSDMVLIEKKLQTIRALEPSPPKPERYRIRYFFLEGEEADYVGMAHLYGNWLLGDTKTCASSTPLFIEVLGGVMSQVNVLGFPVNRVVSLTGYADLETMAKQLISYGADNLVANYVYWSKDGTGAAIPDGIKTENRLGGKKRFETMLETLKQNNTQVYLDFNFTDMKKSRWGFNTRFDSVTSIRKSPALQYQYRINDKKAELTKPTFLLNIQKIKQAANKVKECAGRYDFAGISANTLGQKIYSDFSGRTIKRDMADKEWQDILRKLQAVKGKQLLTWPNAYAVPYADYITDTPIYSSRFMVETYDIPFYQIALHGRVPMSTPPVNWMSDPRTGVLKALESGIGIKYHFIMRNIEKLSAPDYCDVISSLFSDWAKEAADTYGEIRGILDKVSGREIVSHRIITKDVRETVFVGGVSIYVNYGESDYNVNGMTIKAGGYAVLGL